MLFISQNSCKKILKITIKKVIVRIIAHHIVGVQVLFLCNFKNSTAFHKVASSLICLPSLNSIKKFMKYGIIIIQIVKVTIQNENICIK
ncbi:hypothetical protein GW891_02350 [bacterium]|nr:hypothetical protein [bacterium]